MPHMVIFRDAEGRPGYHQSDELEDAVRFVEHLRNEQQVSDTRVFSMQEVPLEFKSYWRVEVGAAAPPADAPVPVPVVVEEPVDAERGQDVDEQVPTPAGRFGLFGRN